MVKEEPFLVWVFMLKLAMKLTKSFFCFYRDDHETFLFYRCGKWYIEMLTALAFLE